MPDAQGPAPAEGAVLSSPAPASVAISGVVLILLAKIKPAYWTWGWNRIAFGRWSTGLIPGLRFFKVLGSGQNGGCGLVPSPAHQGMFCVFDSEKLARDFIDSAALTAQYRERSEELFFALLRIGSARGTWDGVALQADVALPEHAPIATLTRASIRPAAVGAFWKHAPAAQASLQQAPGCALAVGLGEAPLFRQATFSLWDNTAAMQAYAHSGAHGDAIKAAWQHQFFSESMFVRFVPFALSGQWQGRAFG